MTGMFLGVIILFVKILPLSLEPVENINKYVYDKYHENISG